MGWIGERKKQRKWKLSSPEMGRGCYFLWRVSDGRSKGVFGCHQGKRGTKGDLWKGGWKPMLFKCEKSEKEN